MIIDTEKLIAEGETFKEELKRMLGYDEIGSVSFNINYNGAVKALIYCTDDFQERLDYSKRVQHDTVTFDYPLTVKGKLNREQRELQVLLTQQGESTALHSELVSAAGRLFVQALIEERAKYALLVDKRGMYSDPEPVESKEPTDDIPF